MVFGKCQSSASMIAYMNVGKIFNLSSSREVWTFTFTISSGPGEDQQNRVFRFHVAWGALRFLDLWFDVIFSLWNFSSFFKLKQYPIKSWDNVMKDSSLFRIPLLWSHIAFLHFKPQASQNSEGNHSLLEAVPHRASPLTWLPRDTLWAERLSHKPFRAMLFDCLW